MSFPRILALLACLSVAFPSVALAGADEIEEIEDVEVTSPADAAWAESNFPLGERLVNVPLAVTTRERTFLFVIDHRTWAPVRTNPFSDFLGFDSGLLKIGLGLRYGVLDRLDVGLYRLNNGLEAFDTWELDARARLLDHEWAYVDAALRGGLTWFAHEHAQDAVAGFGQLLVTRTWLGRVTATTGLLFHSDSTNDSKTNLDKDWSIAVPEGVEVRILPWLAWDLEGCYAVAGYGSKYPVLTTAVKFLTNRHTFSLVVTNTQYLAADGLVANTERRPSDVIVGFTITRELPL